MFRLVFLTFFGEERFDHHKVHVHESPKSMTIPLILLAILSLGGGWVAAPHLMGGTDHFEAFLHPVFAAYAPQEAGVEQGASLAGAAGAAGEISGNPTMELVHAITGPPVIVAVLGLLLAWWFYIRKPELPEKLAKSLHAPYVLLYNKYYVDEIYNALFVAPLLFISKYILWHVIDEGIIDGVVNGTASAARGSGGKLRELQSGNARSYASWVVLGAVGFAVLLLALLRVSH
jgi:NADH-quinone oxidoreductase subunit L